MIDKVGWVHIRDGLVLCARSRDKDLYYLPGGKRDPGETDAECLTREVLEELGVDVDPDTIVHLASFEGPAHGKPEGTRMRMVCYAAEYRGELRACAEIADIAWLGHADLERTSAMGRIVLGWLYAQQRIA